MSFADRDGLIWFDGEMVPWRDAQVHVLTHTLHYGLGVFEGVRAYDTDTGPAIFRLGEHTQRLFDSAKILRMDMPWDQATVNAAQQHVIRENKLGACYLRPMAFYGSEGMGLRADNLSTHLIIAAWPWGAYLGDDGLTKGIRIRCSSHTRHHVNIGMTRAKANGQYINSMLALQEALQDGYDEALMLDVDGYVSEGSGENFFLIKDGVVYTPQLTSALNGITRRTIMTFCADLGIELVERNITRDDVYIADECFFTGTAAEVTPIREVDNRSIGDGTRGPITEKLQSLYFDAVSGKAPQYADWLTVVS